MGLSIFDEHQPFVSSLVVTSPSGTTNQPILGVPGLPLRIDAIYARSWDAIDHVVNIYVKHAGAGSVIGGVTLPGVVLGTAVAPIEILSLLGFTAQGGLVLGTTDSIEYQFVVTTSTGAVVFTSVGGWL